MTTDDDVYDMACDDYLTGNIEQLPDSFLFQCIAKRGLQPLIDAEYPLAQLFIRWQDYYMKGHSEASPSKF